MADKFVFHDVATYQETDTYRQASPARRRQLNRYKKECGISDEHMLLLMYKTDLDAVPEDARVGSSTTSNVLLIVGVMLLWYSLQTAGENGGHADVGLIALALASFAGVLAVRFFGLLDDYKRAVKKTDDALKGMPEVPDFDEWDRAHPDKAERKEQARAKRRRR